MNERTQQRGAKAPAQGGAGADADLKRRLAEARDHQRADRTAAAEALYREIAKAWPKAPEPRHRLGVLYAQTGRAADGVEHIVAALGLAPDNPLYLNHLGHAYLAAERAEEAARAYRRAIELRPDFADAHFNLANLLRVMGEPNEAAASYRRAVAADPRALHAYINLGMTLQELAAYDEAVEVLRRAAALDAGSFEAHFNLAVVLAAQRRFDEAIEAYRNALKANPEAPSAHVNLGAALQEQGKLDDAIACYGRALEISPDFAQAHLNLGSALSEKGEWTAALGPIRRALALEPRNAQAHVNLAQTLQELGDLAGAEAAFRRALELEPGHINAKAHFSMALQQIGKEEEARILLDYPVLLKTRRLERVAGFPSVAAFNAELARTVYRHPTLMPDPPAKATRHGDQTMEILDSPDAPIAALQRFIEDSVHDYFATAFAAGRAAFAVPPPKAWRLHGWAVVLHTSGYQTPHIHPAGVLSGVYYVRIPEIVKAGGAGEAGFIRFGHPLVEKPDAAAGEAALATALRPEEGMIVLFPSYFWHYTVPFESAEDRISIAFDVIAEPTPGSAPGADPVAESPLS